ncbi:MAG: hypothetical protein U0Q04_03495 [Microbacterium sp.]
MATGRRRSRRRDRGAAALALTPQRPEYQLIPIAVGGAVGVMALFAALFPGAAVASYALGIAIVVTVGNGLPWLAMSSTRIRVISPQSDADVFAAPVPIDADDVRARAAAGHRILLSVRIATGITALAATPLVAGANAAGAALCALAFVGMMFLSRQSFARSNVLALLPRHPRARGDGRDRLPRAARAARAAADRPHRRDRDRRHRDPARTARTGPSRSPRRHRRS